MVRKLGGVQAIPRKIKRIDICVDCLKNKEVIIVAGDKCPKCQKEDKIDFSYLKEKGIWGNSKYSLIRKYYKEKSMEQTKAILQGNVSSLQNPEDALNRLRAFITNRALSLKGNTSIYDPKKFSSNDSLMAALKSVVMHEMMLGVVVETGALYIVSTGQDQFYITPNYRAIEACVERFLLSNGSNLMTFTLEVDFEEVKAKGLNLCFQCKGTGKKRNGDACYKCKGKGVFSEDEMHWAGVLATDTLLSEKQRAYIDSLPKSLAEKIDVPYSIGVCHPGDDPPNQMGPQGLAYKRALRRELTQKYSAAMSPHPDVVRAMLGGSYEDGTREIPQMGLDDVYEYEDGIISVPGWDLDIPEGRHPTQKDIDDFYKVLQSTYNIGPDRAKDALQSSSFDEVDEGIPHIPENTDSANNLVNAVRFVRAMYKIREIEEAFSSFKSLPPGLPFYVQLDINSLDDLKKVCDMNLGDPENLTEMNYYREAVKKFIKSRSSRGEIAPYSEYAL